MPTFLKDTCYQPASTYAACIEFHLDEHHRRAFNASQLIEFSLDPNPDADTDKNEPPQKITLMFSTADVVILGWRLGLIADNLRDNKLSAVGILPKRYADLERNAVYVSSIIITPVDKGWLDIFDAVGDWLLRQVALRFRAKTLDRANSLGLCKCYFVTAP